MPWTASRIRTRIAVPFTLLFVVLVVATTATALVLTSRTLERRMLAQIDGAADYLAGSDLATSPVVLETLRSMVESEIATYDANGELLAASSGLAENGALRTALGAGPAFERVRRREQERSRVEITLDGRPLTLTYRPAREPPGAVVAFAVDTSDLDRAQRAIAWALAGLAALSVAAMAVVSRAVARGITSPLERLAEHSRALAAGELERRAPVEGRDEIAGLARAFDEMAAQLRGLEEKVLRGEKLALTGQLAARVAHDIRTPLTALKLRVQLLARGAADGGEQGEALVSILKEIGRLERCVSSLLDLAKPAELRRRPAGLDQIVTGALEIAGAQLEHHGIRLERRLAGGLPELELDADRLSQALLDVLQNAIEAQPEGGVVVVETAREAGGRGVRVAITDGGAGIAAEHRERVFDPFFTTKREGVGLGLVNARSVVERHGGTIDVGPAPAGGTRVEIHLPAVETFDG